MQRQQLPRLVRGCFFALLLIVHDGICAAPYVPTDDGVVIERLSPDARGDALRRLARAGASASAADPTIAVALARRYIERSRAEADPRLLGYAQGLLAPWWAASDAPTDVLLLRATVLQARHQFDAALKDLDTVIGRRPDDVQAWLTRATILRARGRYPEAAHACARMLDIAPGFASTLCGLSVMGLSGDITGAAQAMQALEGRALQQTPAVQSWFDAELADLFERAGRREEAEARYRAALRRDPAEPGLTAAYADFLLDSDRPAEAEQLTAPLLRIDALQLRNAIARQRLGQAQDGGVEALASGYAAAHRRGEDLHLREEARFALEVLQDPASALDLAQRNWEVQHEPWDARLLIDAAHAAGKPQAAQPVQDWLRSSNLRDVRLDVRSPKP